MARVFNRIKLLDITTVSLGIYFDQDVEAVVGRLLGEQLEDGGWSCEAENGSLRSSFATTINMLDEEGVPELLLILGNPGFGSHRCSWLRYLESD